MLHGQFLRKRVAGGRTGKDKDSRSKWSHFIMLTCEYECITNHSNGPPVHHNGQINIKMNHFNHSFIGFAIYYFFIFLSFLFLQNQPLNIFNLYQICNIHMLKIKIKLLVLKKMKENK
jgi:hypothetical protein